MLSLDRSVADAGSPVARRIAALSAAVGEVTVLTPRASGGKPLEFLRLWRAARAALRAKQFDLITVQDTAYLALLAYLLAKKFGLPLEVQVHGFEKMRGVREQLARFVLRRADRIRVVSQRLKMELTKRYTLTANRLYVLPVYTQIESLRLSGRTEKGLTFLQIQGQTLKNSTFTFLTVGRLVPVKNVALQIRAFARLAKEYPQVRLRIVGNGALRRNLQLLTSNLRLGDKVVFEGEQKDVGRFYEDADAFLLASDAEGWGLAALEAAAYRLPIIMTNVGLANEVLHHDKECIVIPVGDEAQLYGAMKEVLEHPELRARLGEAAFKAFRALPSAEEQIRQQVEEWKNLASRNTFN